MTDPERERWDWRRRNDAWPDLAHSRSGAVNTGDGRGDGFQGGDGDGDSAPPSEARR